MIELLILGFVLFILGVGATIVYDQFKEIKLKRAEQASARRTTTSKKSRPGPKSFQDINEEFLAKFSKHIESQSKTKAKAKKTLTQKDLSIESSLTVEELIERIEEMKKKS